jgi:hypothetical protein
LEVSTSKNLPLHRRLSLRADLRALVGGHRCIGGDEAVGAEGLELYRIGAGGGRGVDQRDGTVDVAGVVDARLGDGVRRIIVLDRATLDDRNNTRTRIGRMCSVPRQLGWLR